MANIYFIGGSPRVGKTQLTLLTVSKKPMFSVSTDAVREALRKVYTKDQKPALFAVCEIDNPSDVAWRINAQNEESKAFWPFVIDYILSHNEDGLDVLVEGVAILPELIKDFPLPYKAVFIGNTSEQHVETILEHAKANKHDWLHTRDEEYVRRFAKFVTGFSEFTKIEAQKYGMQYIEMDGASYEAAQQKARDILLS